MSTVMLVEEFPQELRQPVSHLIDYVQSQSVREDFTELKGIVSRLAEAQERTEIKVEKLVVSHQELAEAQKRTETKVEELAEAQKRTEAKVGKLAEAQKRTEAKVGKLAEAQERTEIKVEELAEAQKRTEIKVEELAEAQKRTENELEKLTKSADDLTLEFKTFARDIDFRITGIGARWGTRSEASFRNGIREILKDTGYTVENYKQKDESGEVFNYPETVEIDVIITGDNKLFLLEIKSSCSKADVYVFTKKCLFYEKQIGRESDNRIIISPNVLNGADRAAKRGEITICDYINGIEYELK